MKYSINDVYICIDDHDLIIIGKVLGPENDPYSLEATEIVTNSEFDKRLRSFDCAYAKVTDCVFHLVGYSYTVGYLYTKDFVGKKSENNSIDTKWINELKLMGYDIDKLDYTLKEN